MKGTFPSHVNQPKCRNAKAGIVVFCTHGISDPLVSSLMLDYLVRLQRGGTAQDVLLFTEEPPLAGPQPELLEQLRALRIQWVALGYDVHGAQWRQKLGIAWVIFRRTRAFLRDYERRWLVGFLSFGGAYAALLGILGLGRNATVCFEPHSTYMVEVGAWGKRSIKNLVMSGLEWLQLRRAWLLVVPTSAGEDQAKRHNPRGRVVLQAITIDVEKALFDLRSRKAVRERLGLGGHTVLAYVGKFGGIYYSHEQYLDFVRSAVEADPMLRFLIIAGQVDLHKLRTIKSFQELGQYLILHPAVPPAELPGMLSGADLGVVAIPPTPAQVYRTPVKTAYYWAAGLPLVIPRGISDDWKLAERHGLGIVTGDLTNLDTGLFRKQLDKLRAENPETLRKRCMEAARTYRDTASMVGVLQRELDLDPTEE